jgi:hypothetical protein
MSRARLLLRVILLAAGGALMLWKAYDASREARALIGGDALLLQRIAKIEALVGVLALGAAAFAAAALRQRRRRHSIDLHDPGRPALTARPVRPEPEASMSQRPSLPDASFARGGGSPRDSRSSSLRDS